MYNCTNYQIYHIYHIVLEYGADVDLLNYLILAMDLIMDFIMDIIMDIIIQT